MVRLAIFDLDGTLVYTIGDIAAALNYGLEKNGFPTLTEREVQALVGYSTAYMCEYALPEEARAQHGRQVHEEYSEYYKKHCCDNTYPYAGVLRTLAKLKNAGIKLAVVSNKVVPSRDQNSIFNWPFQQLLLVDESSFCHYTIIPFLLSLGHLSHFLSAVLHSMRNSCK